MRIILIFLLAITGLIASLDAQSNQDHFDLVAKEYCAGIKALPAVDGSAWVVETLDVELHAITVREAAQTAYLEAEGEELSAAMNNGKRSANVIFGKVAEACPELVANRMLMQQLAATENTALTGREEWKELLRYVEERVLPEALSNEEEMLLPALNKSLTAEPYATFQDSINAQTSSLDLTTLLLTAASAAHPSAMGRYKLEEFDGGKIIDWVMMNGPDSLSRVVGLDDSYQAVCNNVDQYADELAFDLSQIDQLMKSAAIFSPDSKAVEQIAKIYDGPMVNRSIPASAASTMIMMRLFQECDPFRDLMKEQAFEAAMEASEATPEEIVMFRDLMDDLCACLALDNEPEAMECFNGKMKAFGIDPEANIFDLMGDEEIKRKVTIFQGLTPAIGAGCAPSFSN
ncbi:MAG: hypothetical protein AAF597_11075 [Bacteroidota bacterium]